MVYSSRSTLLAIAAFAASSSALELMPENFAEMTAGKTVFLKFYAPWCGHCKAMADDWAQLEKDFEGHGVAMVASVDCTAEANDQICADFNIEGFPTIAWGDASAAEDYHGGRDYESLKEFADEFVTKPICSIFNSATCSDEEKADIAAVEAKSDDELKAAAEKIAELAKEANKEFEAFLEKLNEQYETEEANHNAKIATIKEEHKFKFIQQVFAKRGIASPIDMAEDDDDMMGDEL